MLNCLQRTRRVQMKWVLAIVVMAASRVAAAGCEHGAGVGGCTSGKGCGYLALALMAGVAALGYWVLRHAEKDSGAVRWGGRAVGWMLLVVGLGGLLCGSYSHLQRASGAHQCAHGAAAGKNHMWMMQMPPGHPQIDGMISQSAGTQKKTDRKSQ